MSSRLFQHIGPEKDKFQNGVSSLALLRSGELIVGAGNGTVNVVKQVVKENNGKKCLKFIRTQ